MSSTLQRGDTAHYQPIDEELESHELLDDGESHAQAVHLASLEEKKRLWWRNAFITGACIALWFFFATILSVYNKWMFSPDRFGFPFPLFVTCCHMWIQFAFAALVRTIWPAYFRPPEKPTAKQYGKRVLPTALATCLDIGFSNPSLKAITLSFYSAHGQELLPNLRPHICLSIPFRSFSFRLIGVIGLILIDVVLMVATETSFSLPGFLLVISASARGGLRWSLTQLLLRKDSKNGMELETPPAALFWMALAMGLILGGLSMGVERWIRVFSSDFFDGFGKSLMTLLYIFMPGTLAFCMVISEFYIIQRAGVVPMSVAGIPKEATTISVSAWIFGDHLTPLNLTGVAIAFCGIVLFTYHKYLKSIESPVPLDGHGNPIVGIEIGTATLGSIGLHENRPLNGHDYSLDAVQDLLFSAGRGSDSGDEDHGKPWVHAQRSNGRAVADNTRSVVRESIDVERLWDDEQRERARTQNT